MVPSAGRSDWGRGRGGGRECQQFCRRVEPLAGDGRVNSLLSRQADRTKVLTLLPLCESVG